MKTATTAVLTLLMLVVAVPQAQATSELFEYAFYVDGNFGHNVLPGGGTFNTAGFNFTTGLGTIGLTVTGTGNHTIIGWFNHDFDSAINTFFNEYAAVFNVPAAGQSWEIDEPGYVFGNIFSHVQAGGPLDNANAVPSGSPDDVSWAFGWNFALTAGQTALINFNVGQTAPGGGFYLQQTDFDTGESIFFSSSLSVSGGGGVPEPSSWLLLGVIGTLVSGRAAWSRRRRS